jgi:hypothetical protein
MVTTNWEYSNVKLNLIVMTTNYQPLQLNQRVEFLDLLRGFALLGIFIVNMPLMNAPFVTEMGKFTIWTDLPMKRLHGL